MSTTATTDTFSHLSKQELFIEDCPALKLPHKINQFVPFSAKLKSRKGIALTENNECASKLKYPRKSWVISDIDPVHHGIHCWRILVDNPCQGFIRFGVASKRAFNENTVYGIGYGTKLNRNSWRPTGHIHQRNTINLKHFAQKTCAVDMLLNADEGTLKLCVVGMCNDKNEAKIWGMPTTKLYQRWVPYFAFGSTSNNSKLRVMQICDKYYGKDLTNINPLCYLASEQVRKRTEYKNNSLTFYFCGIRVPKTHKITNKISIRSSITVESSLTESDTIYSLKRLVRDTYDISHKVGIAIFYSNRIISLNDAVMLKDFGVTNESLFVLAIINYSYCIKAEWSCKACTFLNSYHRKKCEMCDVVKRVGMSIEKAKNPLLDNSNSAQEKCRVSDMKTNAETVIKPILMTGFDIITQESDVNVYKMPGCNHVMNKESLYNYALTTFKDANNLYIKCPHPNEEMKCDEWSCSFCTFLNDIQRTRCEMCDNAKPEKRKYCHAKWEYCLIKKILLSEEELDSSRNINFKTYELELLSARNTIEKGCDVQKCPKCQTLYYRNNVKNKLVLNEIKSVRDINQHFKSKCVLCYDKLELERKYEPEYEETLLVWQKWKAVNKACSVDAEHEYEETVSSLMVQAKRNKFGSLPFGFEKPLKWKAVNKDCSVDAKHICDYNGYFCWGCGSEWEYGHICDSSFKHDLVNILLNTESKKIGSVSGVPSVRACPRCCQLITHSEACKHMKCESCKLDFCFVCLKTKKKGNWQCGSSSAVCPITPIQNMATLPNTIVLNKRMFKLF